MKNLFTGSAAIVTTRLCRLCGYFVAFVREVRLNENLLYIPCTLFPLPFFSPTHILINGSFLCECNVRETKSRRRDRSRFIAFSVFSLSLFFYLSTFLSLHVACVCTLVRIEICTSIKVAFYLPESLLRPLCAQMYQKYT